MYQIKKPILSKLNEHLVCKLCKGYFIDATTIIECLHTFCRSCIVKYLQSNKYCPVCDVQVHKSKPLLNLRNDKIIQDLVYKLVPGLCHDEFEKRKQFYTSHPEAKPSKFEESMELTYHYILLPSERLCVALSYFGVSVKPRYLMCPAAVSIAHLQKLIRAKYDLNETYHVDISYKQNSLSSNFTLMDIVYMYQWKKKASLELTYKIFESSTTKRPVKNNSNTIKTVELQNTNANNNNLWKEIQLRISEDGEVSFTGIQEDMSPIEDLNLSSDLFKVTESKEIPTNPKRKKITKLDIKPPPEVHVSEEQLSATTEIVVELCTSLSALSSSNTLLPSTSLVCSQSLNSSLTTTVFSTINSTKCSIRTDDTPPNKCDINLDVSPDNILTKDKEIVPVITNTVNETMDKMTKNQTDRGTKRKLETNSGETRLKNTPNDYTKKHVTHVNNNDSLIDENSKSTKMQANKFEFDVKDNEATPVRILADIKLDIPKQTTKIDDNTTKPKKDISNSGENKLASSPQKAVVKNEIRSTNQESMSKISSTSTSEIKTPSTTYAVSTQPCYMPRTTYNPVIEVPMIIPSVNTNKLTPKTCLPLKADLKSGLPSSSLGSQPNNKTLKSKGSAPIGYKTLRDPPKSWNLQISKANQVKPEPDPKYADLKNTKAPKFFKVRNNMPRYLGNPASGVKPMYSVQISPEKEKFKKNEKTEIKKHSIVKIDPRTLKPISKKAPENSNLSNQVDLKINTSSVSIFNPLKLQGSPKNDRKSPKSPNPPKPKPPSPPSKRDKTNLNFSLSNAFVPNLPLSQNQYLNNLSSFHYYDPRMFAYHTLLYNSRMAYPNPLTCSTMDFNQRKALELEAPSSPKFGVAGPHSPESSISSRSTKLPLTSNLWNFQPKLNAASKKPGSIKKNCKDQFKPEKSLQNAVEKLTQNRVKEIGKNELNIPNPNKSNGAQDVVASESIVESTSKEMIDSQGGSKLPSEGHNESPSKNQLKRKFEILSEKTSPISRLPTFQTLKDTCIKDSELTTDVNKLKEKDSMVNDSITSNANNDLTNLSNIQENSSKESTVLHQKEQADRSVDGSNLESDGNKLNSSGTSTVPISKSDNNIGTDKSNLSANANNTKNENSSTVEGKP